MLFRSFWKSVIVAILVISLAGCAEVGVLGTKTKYFTGHDSFIMQSPQTNILDVVAAAGKDLGYEVSALDKEHGIISLNSSAGMAAVVMIGKIYSATLNVTVEDGGKKLALSINLSANFNEGGQEAAQKRIDEFKRKLSEELAG